MYDFRKSYMLLVNKKNNVIKKKTPKKTSAEIKQQVF